MGQVQVGHHPPEDKALLDILLAKEGEVWLNNVEEFCYYCRDASKECGTRGALHLLVSRGSARVWCFR